MLKIVLMCMLSAMLYPAFAGQVQISPQILFLNSKDRSLDISVRNVSNSMVEVTMECKYGYVTSDDTGKYSVLMPDSVGSDDRSSAPWVRMYPVRFMVGGGEAQTVRVVVSPAPGIEPGDYWSRIIARTREVRNASIQGKAGRGSGVRLEIGSSVPFQYRYMNVNTGLQLSRPMETHATEAGVKVLIPLRRTGNSSYWGSMTCTVKDRSGKKVLDKALPLVVYKTLVFVAPFTRTELPPGDYTVDFVAQTKRTDVSVDRLTQSAPVSWSWQFSIQ